MDLPNVSNKRRWAIVGLLFTASLINYLDRAAISFALPLISRDFHLTPESKGLLLSSFFWSYALMQIPIGWCADRFNLRWLYAGAFALWSLAQGLTGLAGSLAVSDWVPRSSRRRRVHLPSRRNQDRQLAVHAERAWFALRTFRLRYSNGISPRRHSGSLALNASWMAPHFPPLRLCGSDLDRPLVLGFSAALAGSGQGRRLHRPPKCRVFGWSTLLNRNLLGICLGFFCFDYYWYVLVTWLPDYLVTVRHLSIVQAGFYASLAFFTFGSRRTDWRMDGRQR